MTARLAAARDSSKVSLARKLTKKMGHRGSDAGISDSEEMVTVTLTFLTLEERLRRLRLAAVSRNEHQLPDEDELAAQNVIATQRSTQIDDTIDSTKLLVDLKFLYQTGKHLIGAVASLFVALLENGRFSPVTASVHLRQAARPNRPTTQNYQPFASLGSFLQAERMRWSPVEMLGSRRIHCVHVGGTNEGEETLRESGHRGLDGLYEWARAIRSTVRSPTGEEKAKATDILLSIHRERGTRQLWSHGNNQARGNRVHQ